MNVDSSIKSETLDDWTPPSVLSTRIKEVTSSVNMMPDVALKALEMARDPDVSVQTFAALIERDLELAMSVLKLANSPLYSLGQSTINLSHAISRLGFEQCRSLIIASSIESAMNSIGLEQAWIRDLLWKHSVMTGLIATHLNRHMRLGFRGEEFTAGLVHDFGRLLLAAAFPNTFSEFDFMDFDESTFSIQRERDALGSDHCELGAWFAASQNLPVEIREVLRFHHAPELALNCPRLVAVITTADHMANHFQRFEETHEYDASSNPGIQFIEASGIASAREQFERIAIDALTDAVEQTHEFMTA